ncbi:hypothetical protein Bca101_003591 [Brassica carinata]
MSERQSSPTFLTGEPSRSSAMCPLANTMKEALLLRKLGHRFRLNLEESRRWAWKQPSFEETIGSERNSIEEGKQRHAYRKFSRSQQANHQGGARWTNYRSNDLRNARSDDPRNARSEARENSYRYGSAKSSGFEENRRRYDERLIHNLGSSSLSRRPLPALASHDQAATGQTAQHRDQSIPEVTRQQNSPSKEASSQSMHSPQRTISGSQRRGILASRLSDPRTDHGTSEERKSAKEHLSVHISRTSNAKQGESNTSGRLHDVEVQYLEEVKTPQVQPGAITRPSSLNVFDSGRLGSFERSPIRTLSEDRLHVSLRHGPLVSE